MGKSRLHKILRPLLWIVAGLVAFVAVIPLLLYIPFVQDFVKDIALKEVNRATGMTIAVDRLRLRWPLRLSVDGVSVLTAPGDTMLTASRLDVGVRMLPLLRGDIDVDYARLDSAFYQMGAPDSLMWLRARIDRAEISPSRLKMSMENIDLGSAEVDGADVRLTLRPDTAAAPPDTAASKPMLIKARDIRLNRVRYTMSMMPVIDSLGCDIASAHLRGGTVDLGARRINAGLLRVDSIDATYLTPPAAAASAATAAPAPDTLAAPAGEMWVITADSLRLTGRRALYAQRGVRPLPGLDMAYLEVSDIDIAVDSFYNRGTSITVPLRRLSATERCGLSLDASGTFAMTDSLMEARRFNIATNHSTLSLDAAMGSGDLLTDPSLPLRLRAKGRLGLADALLALPSLRSTISMMPAPASIAIDADIEGTPRSLEVARLNINYPGLLDLKATGRVDHPFDASKTGGKVDVAGRLTPTAAVRRSLVQARLLPGISLPGVMTVKGNVAYSPAGASGNLAVTADGGRVAAKGYWRRGPASYDAQLTAADFPVEAFLPAIGVADLSATVKVNGRGYDPFAAATVMHVEADVTRVVYNHEPFADVMLRADLGAGSARGMLSSGNPAANLDMDFDATLSRDSGMVWNLDGEIRNLDLLALRLMTDTCSGAFALKSQGVYNPRTRYLNGRLTVDDVDWQLGTRRIVAGRTDIDALMSDTLTRASVTNGDLAALFTADCGLDTLLRRVDITSALLGRQLAAKMIDVDSVQRALPPFRLTLEMGADNVASKAFLAPSGISAGHAALTASNDSLMTLTAAVNGFAAGTTRLDSINLTATQHGKFMVYSLMVNNRPGTMDAFAHVTLNGFFSHNRLSAMMQQRNIKDETGFSIGFAASMDGDSTAKLRLVPFNPVIAYRQWTVNRDNFISYNLYDRRVGANLTLSDSNSSLRIFTDSTAVTRNGHTSAPGDLRVQLNDIKLEDWLSLSPWAPPMSGALSADLLVHLTPTDITGNGTVALNDFFYNKERVGTFNANVDVATDPRSGHLRADMDLMVDSVRTITVNGVLNDSTGRSPLLLDFNMIRFPLSVANPFLPPGVAKLSGTLNGRMDITGDMAKPVFNGWLNFDSTAVAVTMLGTDFRFSDGKIPVDSGIVTFDNFKIHGSNDNPLTINGTANLRDLADIALDLNLSARDMMIVNSSRARKGADVFGKAYIDLDAGVKGSLARVLAVEANAALLSGTNVTYVMPTATSAISSSAAGVDDMVHFVSFNDTTQVDKSDQLAEAMALILDAGLTIEDGTTVTVDLSPDGSSKVQVQGQGSFTFSMNPVNPGRLTGRYTVNKGMARYNVPMLGEKSFDLLEGSYVAFNGDMLNPLLNIKAVDKLKANVTQSGQNSRLVTFDVGLSVTGSLASMNVVLDLSTDDDITVQNELQSMSAEQRANQAMNLLLYSTYTGPGTTASSNLSGNPLYSFLESKLNSWMANNVKGVDISFGIDQYDRTYDGSTSTTTSYSYRVSKSLFDDRFKILVGGNYSTDANADENFSQNLISDISFEYLLNRSGTMYVRIFRHTGYESILEGEVTQTGVGFVIKRKLDSLRDLFRLRRRNNPLPVIEMPQQSSTPGSTTDE